MNQRIVWAYYLVAFVITLVIGFNFGFSDSHTPPPSFLLGCIFILIGIVWLLIDLVRIRIHKIYSEKRVIAHVIGLLAIGAIIIFILNLGLHFIY